MRLIEPLGLLAGQAAAHAIATDMALPLAGGPLAFALARLLDTERNGWSRIVAVGEVPDAFMPALGAVSRLRPDWAGLPGSAPSVMAILNVTPDSLGDEGRYFDTERAIEAGLRFHTAGAAIVDVGGESTRPGSRPVAPAEEQARILPVIRALARAGVPTSVDTRHASTMRAALDAGANIVNDVSGLAHDPDSLGVAGAAGCPVVLMHMRGTPQTMADFAGYRDVAVEVVVELAERIAAAEAAGVARSSITVDPGVGFAKTAENNLELLPRLGLLLNLGCPIVAGVSRKGFIGRLSGEADPAQRAAGSIAAGLHALSQGASILRVHDVAETVQAMRVWQGLAASERVALR